MYISQLGQDRFIDEFFEKRENLTFLDVGSQFNIVQSIDFDITNIKVFIIENNYKETNIQEYLEIKGYQLYKKLEWDDIFTKK
jgi:hypothetical protein